jgi:hypothetical protein
MVRRRRTRRHRRNVLIRRSLTAVFLTVLTAGASILALMYFSPSLFEAKQIPTIRVQPNLSNQAVEVNQAISTPQSGRPVYPYSVVPGGVEDAKELKWVAEHDPVVAAHYAGFDYERAHIVQLTLAQTVYVSYRIGNKIYWTRRRIKLKKGEKLLTDGRITARTRCANRVEETPQQAAAPNEPSAEKFEDPIGSGVGTAMQAPPASFNSAFLSHPQMPGLGAPGPLTLYNPLEGGTFIPLSPPPLPTLCSPLKKKKDGEIEFDGEISGKKKTVNPCGAGGGSIGTAPEPGTWILFITGIGFIGWQARRKLLRFKS